MPDAEKLERNKYDVSANSEGSFDDNNFTPVNLSKVYNGKVPDSASLSSSPPRAADTKEDPISLKTQSSILKLTPKSSCDDKCRVRAAILATNGKIARPDGVNYGPNSSKKAFFNKAPDGSDYAMVHGTEAEVSSFLNGLSVTSEDMTKHTDLYIKAEEIADGSKWTDGLTTAEAAASFTSDFKAGEYPITNTNDDCHLTNSCTSELACDFNSSSSCKKGFRFFNHGEDVTVTIPYKVTNHRGKQVPFVGYATVDAEFDQWDNNTTVKPVGGTGANGNIVNVTDGNVSFKVPQPYRQDFDVIAKFQDNDTHYIREETVVTVPMKSPKTLNAGDVLLLTSDGRNCAGSTDPSEAECWKNKSVKTGDVTVTVRDGSNNALVEGARVELFEDATLSNSAMMTSTSDSQGKAVFPNMGYDRYYVKYNGSSKFLPTSEMVELQGGDKNGELTLLLHRRDDSSAILSEYMNAGEDKDLAVNVYDPKKKSTCTVEATSKYCAYMTLEDDVDGAQSGYERIKIDKFTESYYLAYKRPTPDYSTTCTYQAQGGPRNYYEDNEPTTIRSLADSFDWSTVRKASSISFETLYCFNGWGLNSKKSVRLVSTTEPTAASVCTGLYPSGTQYALDRLRSLNNQ